MKTYLTKILLSFVFLFIGLSNSNAQSFDKQTVNFNFVKPAQNNLLTKYKKYAIEFNCKSTNGYFTADSHLPIGYLEDIGRTEAFNGLPTNRKRWITDVNKIKNVFLNLEGYEYVENKNDADFILQFNFGWVHILREERILRTVSLQNREVSEEGFIYQFYCDNNFKIINKNKEVLLEKIFREQSNPFYLKCFERDYTTINDTPHGQRPTLLFDTILSEVFNTTKTILANYSNINISISHTLFKPKFKDYTYSDIIKANNLVSETSFFIDEEKVNNFPKLQESIKIYENAINEASINQRINEEIVEHLRSNLLLSYWLVGNYNQAKNEYQKIGNYSSTKKIKELWKQHLE